MEFSPEDQERIKHYDSLYENYSELIDGVDQLWCDSAVSGVRAQRGLWFFMIGCDLMLDVCVCTSLRILTVRLIS